MKFSIKDILSGDILAQQWVRRQYKLTLLICGLFFVYIYFGYQSERQQDRLNDLNKELQDAYFTQQTINAQVMTMTRQSSISKLLEEQGSNLKESHRSAIKIE
ncbi:MAG: hypothetical protein IKW35_02550 [Paludibacteraceae bacterium]|jgi:hypothetical protein|nr:hypothetical protein [Paludibacteraceae bacterium]